MFDALWLGRKIAEEKQNEMEDVFLGEWDFDKEKVGGEYLMGFVFVFIFFFELVHWTWGACF